MNITLFWIRYVKYVWWEVARMLNDTSSKIVKNYFVEIRVETTKWKLPMADYLCINGIKPI